MNLIFEKSIPGHGTAYLPPCDVTETSLPAAFARGEKPDLPEVAEVELIRHYTALAKRCYGVDDGLYPLGSCTMKYNPRLNEAMAALPGFTGVHPLQPEESAQGCLHVIRQTELLLCGVTGMDAMTLQPAAGAHGEFTGLLLIKAYHAKRGDAARTKIIVPDAAHGTNPASAAMAGYTVVNVESDENGCVDLAKLKAAVGPDTAGLMLTNPNTVGIFDPNILEITKIVHDAGGLCYYDGANLNAVVGVARPGDMGFDVVHLNLHKTFSTPHGGGGPGSGPVGCKAALAGFLPKGQVEETPMGYRLTDPADSIGRVRGFYGNFLVAVRALTYLIRMGGDGLKQVAEDAVLNANYLKSLLSDCYEVAFDGVCMHEFVLTLEKLKETNGVSAMDVAKAMIDRGIHPPTMYFPLIVHEALMFEPTETESKATLEQAAEALLAIYQEALSNPDKLHAAPATAPIGRPDEVKAARTPVLRA